MIERLRESKWFYVLVSVAIAFAVWATIRGNIDPEQQNTFHNIRVELTGTNVLTRQGLTVAELSAEEVDLRIEAPVSVLENLWRYRDDFWVTVDVSKCVEGENKLAFAPNYPTNFNAENAVIQERDPDTIVVMVEKLYTKTYPVEFRLDGKVAKGYQAGTPVISPETVVVSGSVEQVSQIKRVVAVLHDEELDEQFAGDLPLVLLDDKDEVLTDLDVTLDTQSAYVVLPVVVIKEIPLTVNFVMGGGVTSEEDFSYEMAYDSITISGAADDVNSIDELSLGSIDLAEVIGYKSIPMAVTLDPSLENVSGLTTVDVTVTIEGLSTRTLEVDNIVASNVPRGYKVEAVNKVKAVMIRGRDEELNLIDASQIRIVADLSNFRSQGTYSVPARVYLDASSGVGVIGEYHITMNISR